MVCDSHIHFIPKELSSLSAFYKGIWSDKEKLYEYLSLNQIKKSLLVSPSFDINIDAKWLFYTYNKSIIKIAEENKNIIPAGILNLEDIENLKEQLRELKNMGFKVVNLFSSYKGKFIIKDIIKYFEDFQNFGFFIFFHPQTNNPIGFERINDPLLMPVLEYTFDLSMCLGILLMEEVFDKFNIKFIFSSLGGVIPFLKDRFDRVYIMLRAKNMVKELKDLPSNIFKKIYVDTSGSNVDNIKIALDTFGENNVLWGSDYPANTNIKNNIDSLNKLGSPLKEKIIKNNFLSLFNE